MGRSAKKDGYRRKIKDACQVMPRVLAFMAWISWFNYFSGDPFAAFMETMVVCEPPVVNAHGRCPTGSVARNNTCVAVPSSDPDWSLSGKCADKGKVLNDVAKLNGMNQFLAAGLSLASVFFGGAAIDSVGRKPVLMTSLAVNFVVKVLLCISCFVPWAGFAVILIVQNTLMVMSMAPMYPAMNAMVADLSKGDEALRGDCFALMEIVNHISDVSAFLAGYPILAMHLTSYAAFWGSLAVIAAIAFFSFSVVLQETKPPAENDENSDEPDRRESSLEIARDSCKESMGGFKAGADDSFLGQFLFLWALVSLGVQQTWGLAPMYAQSFMHLSQEKASLCRALWHIAITIGSALSSALIRRLGANAAFGVGLLLMAFGWGACGLGPLVPEARVVLFWGSALGIGGVAFGVLTPCFNTILSGRVTEDLQGKVFASSAIINTLVGMSLGLLWPFCIFNPEDTGEKAGLMWLVSAAIFLCMLLWLIVLAKKHRGDRRWAEEIASSVEGDLGDPDDFSSLGDSMESSALKDVVVE